MSETRKPETVEQPWVAPPDEKTDPRIVAAIEKHAPAPSKLRDLAVAVAAVATSVVVVLVFVRNEARAGTDAGVQVMTEKHEALKARVETLEQRFDRFEERTDKQMNAALDALRVPLSARPPPLDGGAP